MPPSDFVDLARAAVAGDATALADDYAALQSHATCRTTYLTVPTERVGR